MGDGTVAEGTVGIGMETIPEVVSEDNELRKNASDSKVRVLHNGEEEMSGQDEAGDHVKDAEKVVEDEEVVEKENGEEDEEVEEEKQEEEEEEDEEEDDEGGREQRKADGAEETLMDHGVNNTSVQGQVTDSEASRITQEF